MNYYEILEISQNASPEVIQNAYKTLAKKYHPDVYQGDKSLAEEQMKQINEAYEVLSDPQKRMEYDYQREENCHTGSAYDTSEETKQEDTSTESSVETAASQSAGKQKRKKPFWALSWIFITFLMFLSIMFEWKWLFVMSLVLGCARFIANKREPAYKTRGLVRVISIGVVGFMIFSCYLMLYDTTITDDDNYIESTLDSRVEMSDINKTNVDTVNTLSEEYSAESAIESITDKIEDEEIRNTINGFVKSINKKDKKDYLEYYHPDCREAVEKSEKAYAFSLAVMKKSNPMIMTRIILDKMDIDVSIKENSVRSQVVYEDEAIVFIEYKISYDSQNIDKPDIVEALIKYSLSESDGKWYITEFTELPLDYDVDIVTNGYDIIKGSNFNEGIAFIGYYKDKAKYTVGAIDIYGNLLFELTDFSEDDELPVIYGGMFLRGNVVYDDTGNIIASPDLSGYDEIWEEKISVVMWL